MVFPLGAHLADVPRLVTRCQHPPLSRICASLCEQLDRPYLQAPIGLHSTPNSCGRLANCSARSGAFIEKEKHTTIKPIWTCGDRSRRTFSARRVSPSSRMKLRAGVRHFLEDEMGLLAISRFRGGPVKRPTMSRSASLKQNGPLILFGSFNERMYAAEAGGRSRYILRRFRARSSPAYRTPFMGYSELSPLSWSRRSATRCSTRFSHASTGYGHGPDRAYAVPSAP